MTQCRARQSYDEVQQLFDDQHLLITIAEIQGLLMGFYAAGLELDDSSWKPQLLRQLSQKDVLVDVVDAELTAINSELYEMICQQLFALQLLLPDESQSTVERGESLGYWCQGFLLGYLQVSDNNEETDEDVIDALDDLEEISNIDLDTIGNTEEDEKLLFEITEHIRVAAQLIHSVNGKDPSAGKGSLLH